MNVTIKLQQEIDKIAIWLMLRFSGSFQYPDFDKDRKRLIKRDYQYAVFVYVVIT